MKVWIAFGGDGEINGVYLTQDEAERCAMTIFEELCATGEVRNAPVEWRDDDPWGETETMNSCLYGSRARKLVYVEMAQGVNYTEQFVAEVEVGSPVSVAIPGGA